MPDKIKGEEISDACELSWLKNWVKSMPKEFVKRAVERGKIPYCSLKLR